MVRRANYHDPLHALLRVNRVVVLALLWAALAACMIGSLAFDIVDWLNAWRDMSVEMTIVAAAV